MRRLAPRTPAARAASLAVVVAVGVGLLLPQGETHALPVLVVESAAVLAAVAVVVRTTRSGLGASRLRWWLLAVAGLLTAHTAVEVATAGSGTGRLVVLATQVLVAALVVWSTVRGRHVPHGPVTDAHGWTDVALALVGTAVGVTAVLYAAVAAGVPTLSVVTLGVDVVVMAAVLWLWLSREGFEPAARLVLAAGVLYPAHDVLDVLGDGAPVVLAALGRALGPLAVVLLLMAAASRSLPAAVARGQGTRMRRGSARMHLVVPAAAVPPAAWLLGLAWPAAALPEWLLQLSGVAITALALWRALRLLVDAEEAAGLDPLTGLLDRRGLLRQLDGWVSARRSAWLCLIDLDDFKLVNDQRGHEAGDALLVAVAERLVGELPASATVARLGGDELVVLLEGPAADHVAAKVLDVFSRPFALSGEGDAVRISASLGVTELTPGTGAAAAMVCADVAMYVAKRRGRDRWVAYDPSLREQVLGAGQVQRELRVLLHESGAGEPAGAPPDATDAADRAAAGALVVHYQPVVDLVTGLPSGVEALVRWHHPRRGLVPPDSFLALAEAAGLGPALDRWVLHQALHQMAGWDAAGLVGLDRVAVNLGVSSVRSPTLGEDVAVALRAAAMTPQRLLLEITEHDELQADRAAAETLLALREAGVTIALDDFGAGYASIGY
ncbi:MAG: diguanylate cyclase/phosphodiesterase (GGDEF & EAL domains) with PAS/PAC sensor(s), partial [uncultured Quadrisphaera sp.]